MAHEENILIPNVQLHFLLLTMENHEKVLKLFLLLFASFHLLPFKFDKLWRADNKMAKLWNGIWHDDT